MEFYSLVQLPEVVRMILEKHEGKKIFAVFGAMGAGKTTLIKAFCQHLGVSDMVSSPTFGIVHQYVVPTGGVANHFDFYRIKSIEEVYDIGYEEYLYSGNYCFIEWPEKIESLLPYECVRIYLEDKEGRRFIRF